MQETEYYANALNAKHNAFYNTQHKDERCIVNIRVFEKSNCA